MENQKIINLLNKNDVESKNFATRKWYVINDTNNTNYGGLDANNPTTVKFKTKVLKPNFCDYSDAYILVTGKISVVGGVGNIRVAFKNCAPFTECAVQINDENVETLILQQHFININEMSHQIIIILLQLIQNLLHIKQVFWVIQAQMVLTEK